MTKWKKWMSPDALTVAVIAWPDMILSSIKAKMTPVTCSSKEGAVYLDMNSAEKNVEIIEKIDVERFKDELIEHFK